MASDPFQLGEGTATLVAEVRPKHMRDGDGDWTGTHERVSSALFPDDSERAERFRARLASGHACPAGRILAGAGSGLAVTWWNCFVSPLLQDSMRTDDSKPGKGIMEALANVAYSMQAGGGVGTDFSPLRPKDALVARLMTTASGPLAFMDMWDSMCRTIMSAGHRRGAMMATLRCDHPDIFEAIGAKRTPGRLTMFNLSVLVTDDFMRAKDADLDWELGHPARPFGESLAVRKWENPNTGEVEPWYVYRRVKARDLWNAIVRSTYVYAEPGVIFIDRVNAWNNLHYCEKIQCCNPCFSGDTKVWTIDGPRRFDELASTGATISVLTELEDGSLAYRPMVRPRLTRRNSDLVEVTFKARRGSWGKQTISLTTVRVTPDHEFYLKDGSIRQAGELSKGDRIESAYRTVANQKGYISVRSTNGDRTMEHYLIAEHDHGRRPSYPEEHGHHVNEIKDDNVSGNVEIVASGKHNSDHMVGDRNPMRNWYPSASEEERSRYRDNMSVSTSGERNGMFGRKHSEDIRRKIGEKTRLRAADPEYRNKVSRSVKEGHARRRANANHVVVEVNRLAEREDVYCGTVPATGRFFISLGGDHYEGVLVSNCGEQQMAPDDNCNLFHVNLTRCVVGTPFARDCVIDFEALDDTVDLLVRAADNVVDLSPAPTDAQRAAANRKRRIGLGITGLANLLMFLGQRYGSDEALDTVEMIMGTIRDRAYRTSIELAREKGPFPAFVKELYLEGKFIKTLPPDLREGIAQYGIRNSLLLTIAPTGTVSITQAQNASGGIEPVFAARYERRVLQPDGGFKTSAVEDLGFRVYANVLFGGDMDAALAAPLPDYMVTTKDLSVEDHIRTQAIAQKYVDNSISKTINVPVEMGFDEFSAVYDRAYELGCKSCTTYRPDPESGRGAVLIDADAQKAAAPLPTDEPRRRPEVLDGRTYRLRWSALPYPMFVTINDELLDDGRRIPFEVFINSKAVDYSHWVSALTRMISAVLRRGGDLSFLPEELKQVYSARGGEWIDRRYVPSEVALIGLTLERHFREIGYLPEEPSATVEGIPTVEPLPGYAELGQQCQSCGQPTVVRQEGCNRCISCGWSNCG